MAIVFWHSTLPERRVSRRFSFGAFTMGSFWAFSQGMPVRAGKLYVFDALSTTMAAMPVAIGVFLEREEFGWIAAVTLFFAARLYTGFRAPQWLKAFLIERGYKPAQ